MMRKSNKIIIPFIISFIITLTLLSRQSVYAVAMDPFLSELVLLSPEEESHKGFPVMSYLPDTASLYRYIHAAFENTFLKNALRLNSISQLYASHLKIIDEPQSTYLAITKNQGGFAKKGFYLHTGDTLIDKTSTPYIDITENAAEEDLAGLMSLTQLFPHELGHVFYHLFSPEDSISYNNHSVDMHYFSVITDYPTAFNEGFAEHMENVARQEEKNDSIRLGIEQDLQSIQKLTEFSKKRFERDLRIPLRIGYYKASMVNWFQKYEDLKRHRHVVDGTIRFRSTTPGFRRPADRITYRNTALEWDSAKVRNKVQAHSTEGMISSFFTMLTMSELGTVYRDSAFYSAFNTGDELRQVPFDALLSPIENMFVKYFYVFNNFLVSNNSEQSQLIDFMEGYFSSFPDESQILLEVYAEVFGERYSPSLPPPIWLLVKNYEHRLLTLDAYGAITIPLYTFDLNAAEPEDLLTINGFSEEHARAIINYRDENGLFNDLQELETVPGVDSKSYDLLLQHAFENADFENGVDAYDSDIQIGRLFTKPILNIGLKVLIYLAIFYLVYYMIISKGRKKSYLRWIVIFLGNYLLWLLAVLTGVFMVVAFDNPIVIALIFFGLLLSITYLIYRKNQSIRESTLAMQFSLFIILIISLI